MSAELLREAAALMRQRAEAATGFEWTHGPHFQRINCASVFAGKRTDGHYLAMYATPADAEHIASWHPSVALAVARAMDDVAQAWEISDGWTVDLDDHAIRFEDTVDGGWLNVARAYLDRPS